MSHEYYNNMWLEAQTTLGDLLTQELAFSSTPELNKEFVLMSATVLYIRYIQVARQLEQIHDQIVHPQKRNLVRVILDNTIGRLLEVKEELVMMEAITYQFYEDLSLTFKILPHEMDPPIPKYFLLEREKVLEEREAFLNSILAGIAKYGEQSIESKPKDESGNKKSVAKSYNVEEVIKIIQTHERARAARQKVEIRKELREKELRRQERLKLPVADLNNDEAATVVQRIWRGYNQRLMIENMKNIEKKFLDMELTDETEEQKNALKKKKEVEEERRKLQELNQAHYIESLNSVKDQIREQEGPTIKQTMIENIRQWFLEARNALGKFPNYPTEEEGGSASLFIDENPAEIYKEGGKRKFNLAKAAKAKEERRIKKEELKQKRQNKNPENWEMKESSFLPILQEACVKYSETWAHRDEELNIFQRCEMGEIRKEKRKEVENEIQFEVDELMRNELKNLKLAIDKNSSTQQGKKRRKKKAREKKKIVLPDMNSERTIESIYAELVTEGIIKKPKKVFLKDFLGETSIIGSVMKFFSMEPTQELGDVRRVIVEYAILRLGSETIHRSAPLIKSLLITGPRGSGKKMLVDAIVNETGANLFDLSATNILGKYPGINGLRLLLHMIFKVGIALQPSVILIEDCEKMFRRRVPKTDTSDPKRLRKELPRMLRYIGGDQRLLIIGISNLPFDAEIKPFLNFYQKFVLIHKPDYASRMAIWKQLILKHGGILKETFDISSLAKATDGFTAGSILQAIEATLTEEKLKEMKMKPLMPKDFIPELAKCEPLYTEEVEAFKNWYSRTPIGRKRTKLLAGPETTVKKQVKRRGRK